MRLQVREPGLVPSVFQQAFHVMRSGRPTPVLIVTVAGSGIINTDTDKSLVEFTELTGYMAGLQTSISSS